MRSLDRFVRKDGLHDVNRLQSFVVEKPKLDDESNIENLLTNSMAILNKPTIKCKTIDDILAYGFSLFKKVMGPKQNAIDPVDHGYRFEYKTVVEEYSKNEGSKTN